MNRKPKPLPIWVRFKLPVTKAEARRLLAKPCKTKLRGCATCDSWAQFHRDGNIWSLQERSLLLHIEGKSMYVKDGKLHNLFESKGKK